MQQQIMAGLAGVMVMAQLAADSAAAPVVKETARLEAAELSPLAGFGFSLNIDTDVAIVGAASDDNRNGFRAGAAFIFERQADRTWRQLAKLLPKDTQRCGQFGRSVDIQGSTAVVGQYRGAVFPFPPLDCPPPRDSGAAYVFEKHDGAWIEAAKLVAPPGTPTARFGAAVALDGDIIVVSARGGAQIFKRNAQGAWLPTGFLRSSDPNPGAIPPNAEIFGDIDDVDVDGKVVIIGSQRYATEFAWTDIYEEDPDGVWRLATALVPPLGALAVELAQDVALVGENLYQRETNGQWELASSLIPAESVDFLSSSEGDVNSSGVAVIRLVGGTGGAAFFQRSPDGNWYQTALTSPFPSGQGVALDDDHLVLGGGNPPGAAAIFDLTALPVDLQVPSIIELETVPGVLIAGTTGYLVAMARDWASPVGAIKNMDFSMDGGASWIAMSAGDGRFDENWEAGFVGLGPFSKAGTVEFCARATDYAGNTGDSRCGSFAIVEPGQAGN